MIGRTHTPHHGSYNESGERPEIEKMGICSLVLIAEVHIREFKTTIKVETAFNSQVELNIRGRTPETQPLEQSRNRLGNSTDA